MKPDPPWACDLLVITNGKKAKCPNPAYWLSQDGFHVCRRCKGLMAKDPERVVIPSLTLEEWKEGKRLRLFEVLGDTEH
jgi:hypothetical protein